MNKLALLLLPLFVAGPAFAGGPERGYERDDRRSEHRHERGHQPVQLGPRPQWLVDDMDDSPLKRRLQRCEVEKPRSSRFSIGTVIVMWSGRATRLALPSCTVVGAARSHVRVLSICFGAVP